MATDSKPEKTALYYVGYADVVRLSKGDLRRVDPDYDGEVLTWNADNYHRQDVVMTELLQRYFDSDPYFTTTAPS